MNEASPANKVSGLDGLVIYRGIDMNGYTHPKGKGAGKYNGMRLANDWIGKRVRATRPIRNGGGNGVATGTLDTEVLEIMVPGMWYYMVGRDHSVSMDKLVTAGFIERGPNPVGPWPAYRKKA